MHLGLPPQLEEHKQTVDSLQAALTELGLQYVDNVVVKSYRVDVVVVESPDGAAAPLLIKPSAADCL